VRRFLIAALTVFAVVCVARAQNGPPAGAYGSGAGGGTGCGTLPTTPNSRAQVCTSTPSGGVGQPGVFGLPGDTPTDRPSGEATYTFLATDIGTSVRETNAAGETFTVPDGNTGAFVLPVNIGIIVEGGLSIIQRTTSSQFRCLPNGPLVNTCLLASGSQYILKETSDFNYTLSVSGDIVNGCVAAGCIWFPWYGAPVVSPGPQSALMSSVANQPFLAKFTTASIQKITKVAWELVTGTAATTGDIGIYGNCGTTCSLQGHTGSIATTASGTVFTTSFLAVTSLPPGTYYLATCDSANTPAALVGQISSFSNVLAAAGVANNFGTDATDTCTAGVLPNTITVANITNGTGILAPIALMATN
jgi:hypothetical protein